MMPPNSAKAMSINVVNSTMYEVDSKFLSEYIDDITTHCEFKMKLV